MIVAATMGIMDQDLETMERMELGSLEEDTGSYNKREQKRRKKKKINSCGPTAFQVKRCFLKIFLIVSFRTKDIVHTVCRLSSILASIRYIWENNKNSVI